MSISIYHVRPNTVSDIAVQGPKITLADEITQSPVCQPTLQYHFDRCFLPGSNQSLPNCIYYRTKPPHPLTPSLTQYEDVVLHLIHLLLLGLEQLHQKTHVHTRMQNKCDPCDS